MAHTGLKIIGFVAPNAFLDRMDWLYDLDVTEKVRRPAQPKQARDLTVFHGRGRPIQSSSL